MRSSFHRIFWGFILVIFEFHFLVADVLPDPLGYYLIYSGLTVFGKEYLPNRKAQTVSLMLILISLPTVFIQQSGGAELPGDSLGFFYLPIVNIMRLVLAFYIFQFMLQIAETSGLPALLEQTRTTFTWYMGIRIATELLQPFLLNMDENFLPVLATGTAILALIVEIVFLVLLRKFRNSDQKESVPESVRLY